MDPTLIDELNRQLGKRFRVMRNMAGATSSDLYLLDSRDDRFVARLFRTERWKESAAELTERELHILRAVTEGGIPAPAPVTAIADQGLLMSWLPGTVVLPAYPSEAWLRELAAALAPLHRSSIQVPFGYRSWNDSSGQLPPGWWREAALWDAARSILENQPAYQPCFIHRDYHPVNVLWEGDRITGIVDWINACMGPAAVDLAHCRLNLALMYDLRAADLFLSAYQPCCPEYRHDPYWDLDDAFGALPDIRPYPPWAEFGLTGITQDLVQERFQAFVGAAVDAASGSISS
jgi:Ser/Thr protein kinase RdoA (MazF antagonist)